MSDEPEFGPWCEDEGKEHQWGEWQPSLVDALLECRFCPICGGMEQQWICTADDCTHDHTTEETNR